MCALGGTLWFRWIFIGLLIVPSVRGLDCAIIFVHAEVESVALPELAMRAAVTDLVEKRHIDVDISEMINVTVKGRVPKIVLDSMCSALDLALATKKTPLILDMTSSGVASETVKSFAATMAIPTVTTSVGKVGDIKAWHALDPNQLNYLVQIVPPADILIEVVRAVVIGQNLPDIAIFYGEYFSPSFKAHSPSIEAGVPGRVITRVYSGDIRHQIRELRSTLKFNNFFILGHVAEIEYILNEADELRYLPSTKWFVAALKREEFFFNGDMNIMMMTPVPEPGNEQLLKHVTENEKLQTISEVEGAFYYDVAVRTILAAQSMAEAGTWPSPNNFFSCKSFSMERVKGHQNFDLRSAIEKVDYPWTYAPFSYGSNGETFMAFNVLVERWTYHRQADMVVETIGEWRAGHNTLMKLKEPQNVDMVKKRPFYRVVTLEQEPFVIKTKDKFSGLCIDLLENISRALEFDYEIYDIPGANMGFIDDSGEWTGIVGELVEKRADIGMTAISIMVERERVIDFTLPYYEPVGISILMKKSQTPTSLFKFLTVLETDVWLCILAAYFLTSFLMWVFDRWSPYSYQNNKDKYKDDEEKRIFNIKECLWFCLTSLTPQGGGEAPKNLSGRLVAATWWLFGFIIMASYTANLAAFLTVSRLDTPIESLEDLSKQYKIRYAPLKDSSEMKYFKRMADIENQFYEIWKDMSLNDSLTPLERSKLAVWDYPVSDRFTKMWQAMVEAGMPNGMDEALARMLNQSPAAEPFALLNDATENLFYYSTSCDLQIVGDQFSRKPYAIALQKGSQLRKPINQVLQQLISDGLLEAAKKSWWNFVTVRPDCEELKEEEDGISIKNIGGVFIVILLGIGVAILTLTLEYMWYKYMAKNPSNSEHEGSPSRLRLSQQADEAARFANKYLDPHNLYGDHFTRRQNVKGVLSNNYFQW